MGRAGPLLALLALAAPSAAAAADAHPRVDAAGACVAASCHDGGTAAAASVHEPHAAGDCRACHDLSLAPGARRVRGAPAGGGADAARGWDLPLCAACHGDSLYARDAPPGATGFADGERNLHALHVQAGRGARCVTCHEPHAARQRRLLREFLPARGGARIPQRFEAGPQGGRCRTGCHAPKSYRR